MELFPEEEVDRIVALSRSLRKESCELRAHVEKVNAHADAAIYELKQARDQARKMQQLQLFG